MSRRRTALAATGALGLFLLVQLGALALVQPFEAAGYRAVEDPGDPTNSIVYLVAILLATGLMLAAFHFGVDRLVQLLVVGSAGLVAWYVFSILVPPVAVVRLGGTAVPLGSATAAVVLAVALLIHPEWYVIDTAGVVMGAGAAALFGISFGLLPAIVLLVVLAVYDAISVYGTEHMLTLAAGVMDLKIPVVLVIPLSLSYSYLEADLPAPTNDAHPDKSVDHTGTDATAGQADDPGGFDRDAFFIGLGDAVVPTVLVASAATFAPPVVPTIGIGGFAVTTTSVAAMAGTLLGLIGLLWLVGAGRPHAGLPLLNGGAIAGYLLAALAAGQSLTGALGL